MAERTINIGLATFRRADAPEDVVLWGFGLHGQVVDVHDGDLERFDRLNAAPATDQPDLPEQVSAGTEADSTSDSGEQEPPRSGKGSGLDAWVAYAERVGIEVPDGASRDDLIALVDSNK